MALVLPITPNANELLITKNDLGKGFSIGDRGSNAKKSEVFICEENFIKEIFSTRDTNNLSLIRDSESLKAALDVGGEISLSYGLISGKVMGNYMDVNTSSNERMTFLYSRKIVSKVLELDYYAPPSKDIASVLDIENLKSTYGLYYISKIEYGAALDLKITLESSDKETMNQIKGELSGSVTMGALSLSVKAHLDKEDSSKSSKLKVTSSVFIGGGKQMDKTDVQSFDDAMKVIDSFKVNPDSLVPVRMEVSPIPSRASTLLSLNPLVLTHYKNKISSIGLYYWELQQMITVLDAFKRRVFDPLEQDADTAKYVNNLNIGQIVDSLKKTSDNLIEFLQNPIKTIIESETPCSDKIISDIKINAQQTIGTIPTVTKIGIWSGPTINKLPTYKGTYNYKFDGSKYEGLCLNGLRHGQGKLSYIDGNIDQINSIEGIWEEDEVYFPVTITYEGGKTELISTKRDSMIWRHRLNKENISESITLTTDISKPEHILKYFVNVDLVKSTEFNRFYKETLSSLGNRFNYNFLFLGLKGTGKTTMIELLLNILTGQIYDGPRQLCERKLDALEPTKVVCIYEIVYCSKNTKMFTFTIVDTPGFTDSNDSKEDCNHMKSILSNLGDLERIDNVSYFSSGELTRKSYETLRVLHNIFSVLPKEAFKSSCSTITTFNDKSKQDSDSLNILNEILDGIKDKPSIFINNQWSQNNQDKFKELQGMIKTKTSIIERFFIERIQSKSSFQLKETTTQQLFESKITKTERGTWTGLSINGIPTYFGTYKYLDGKEYEGFCLNGKRNGEGKLNYNDGDDKNQIESINGKWIDDEVYFPSTITYKDGKTKSITDEASLNNWKDSLVTEVDCSIIFNKLKDLETTVDSIDQMLTSSTEKNNESFDDFIKRIEFDRRVGVLKKQFDIQLSELEEAIKEFPPQHVSDLNRSLVSKKSKYKLQIENAKKDNKSERAIYLQKILDKI
ncbi:hypothetical protein ACTA71_009288 [Dictyostelium dimigraforme]